MLGALARNQTLLYLNLRNLELLVHNNNNNNGGGGDNNGWEQESAIAILVNSLSQNTTLVELEMDWCLLGTKALAMLYGTNHPSLPTHLCLRKLKLNTADAFRLSNMLSINTTLVILDLSYNNLGNEGSAGMF